MKIKTFIDVTTALDEGLIRDVQHQRFYFADSWSGLIWAYDYDIETEALSNRRDFVTMDQSNQGAADGGAVDAEGCLWNANFYARRFYRRTPDGAVKRVIEMPVRKVTSMNFGGSDMDVLYVASMAKPPLQRFPCDGPPCGSVCAITGLGISGIPKPRFGA